MKKITALVLSVTLLMSVFSVQGFAWGYTFETDITQNEWINTDQLSVLYLTGSSSWDEVQDMTGRSEEIISRWLFAYYVRRISGIPEKKADGFEALFKDLTSEHQYYAAINAVVDAGLMKGDPDGKFRPNEPITAQEAARVLLSLLGYDKYIAAMGYPAAINKTKIFDGLPKDAKELTHAQILRMIYNMYMSPAVKEEAYSGTMKDGITWVDYVIDEDYLGLEHLEGIIFGQGIMDGVKGTTLVDCNENLADDEIMLDGEVVKFNHTMFWAEPSNMLGYNVDYYYRESSDGVKTVLYMFPNNKNSELTVTQDNIESYSNGEYVYYDKNDKEKTISITNDTSVIYNSVATPAISDEEMIPRFGTVTFLDNDGKRGYEVVKIENYEFYGISTLNNDLMTVYDSNSGKKLDILNADEVRIYGENGEIDFSRLKKGNMLAVKRSSSNSPFDKISAELVAPTVKKVKITAVNDDEIKAGELTYTKWDGLDVEKDEIYTLFSYNDLIVMALPETGGAEYAYLVSAAVDGVFEKSIKFRLVDMTGNEMIFDGAKTVYVDGVKKDYEQVTAILMETALNSTGFSPDFPMAQPVKYEVNGNGQLSKLDTKVEEAKEYANPDDASFTSAPDDSEQVTYYSENSALYNSADLSKSVAAIDSLTKVIFVPIDRNDIEAYWNKSIINYTKMFADICDRNEVRSAGAVFAYYDPENEGVYSERKYVIVSDLREEYNAEKGESEYFVDGYLQATAKTYGTTKENFEKLGIGDVIRVETDRYNKIVAFELTFDIDKDYSSRDSRIKTLSGGTYPLGAGYKTIFGTPVDMKNGVILFTQSMPSDVEGWDPEFNADSYTTKNASFWKYTEVRGVPVVEKASPDDIVTYEMDPENVSKVVVNVGARPDQIYIIDK